MGGAGGPSTVLQQRGGDTQPMPTRKHTTGQGGQALAVAEPVDDRGFRKANEAIGLRVREGRLSLLARKIFNVMMYHAQEQRTPGANAPIDTPAARKYFWIALSDLARDAAYDSKDTEFLKQQLDELQNIKLLLENERQWTSERLVASVTLVNPLGLRKHAGQLWLGYAFPPEVHELVMAPGTYTRFSIFYQGLLRSGAALALYEVCRRYATNPSRLTLAERCEHWHAVLTGNPAAAADALPAYKYFKRDVVKPAMAEINALTDIRVELVEHKNGRRVERLQFRVEKARHSPVAFPAAPVIDVELLDRIARLGFGPQEAADLAARYADEKLRACVAYAEARTGRAHGTLPESPAACLRRALDRGPPVLPAAPPQASEPAAGADDRAARPRRAREAGARRLRHAGRRRAQPGVRALQARGGGQPGAQERARHREPDGPLAVRALVRARTLGRARRAGARRLRRRRRPGGLIPAPATRPRVVAGRAGVASARRPAAWHAGAPRRCRCRLLCAGAAVFVDERSSWRAGTAFARRAVGQQAPTSAAQRRRRRSACRTGDNR